MADFDKSRLGDYVDVAARIAEFRAKYPEGSLQPADLSQPYRVETIGDRTFVVVVAAAYRTADDQRPGIGMAYESFPGRTPYTRDSELMNAETSAWGRAIVAVLAADTKRGMASADEVRNRREPQWDPIEQDVLRAGYEAEIEDAQSQDELAAVAKRIGNAKREGEISNSTSDRLLKAWAARRGELNGEAMKAVSHDAPVG